MREYFCIIPARGGSKRIPDKNIQLVDGVPLIGHVIMNAIKSKVFSKIYVSTDSERIAEISVGFGAIVPRLREPKLSDDYTPTRPVIADFISKESDILVTDSVVACIYPFAILAKADLLRAAQSSFEVLSNEDCYLVSIQKYSHPIQRAFTLSKEGILISTNQKSLEMRTQDLPVTFHDAGQFYFAKSKTWLLDKSVLLNAYGFELPRWSAVDVDNIEDLEELRRIFKAQK